MAGAAIAKSALKVWLKDDPITAEAGGAISEILIKKIPEVLPRRNTERTFGAISDLAADSILKLLKKEAGDADEERLIIIANAAAETLSNTTIDAETLAKHNLEKDSLVDYFLSRTGADGGNPALAGKDPENTLFPESEQHIYRRVLTHASQLIVDMSSNFPQFEQAVSKELLQRTESMAEQVIEGMNRVVSEQADAFEADYRNACVRKWDHLELFGVDLPESNNRYNLSVAYVTLEVERITIERDDDGSEDEDREAKGADLRDSMPADKAVAHYQRLFVRGPAGSGKTTLTQWFAVFAAARKLEGELSTLNDCVPFLIKLRNFSEIDFPTPEDFPKEASRAMGSNAPAGWAHQRLTSGKALVLIDGLDEVPEERRNDVREWLNDLTGAFPKARYLITSRPHAAKEGWLHNDDFVDAELQDMARADIHNFIDHWHEAVAEAVQEEHAKAVLLDLSATLKEKLGKNAATYRLATSPLLCALLCALHRQREENLPSDRVELYKLCIEMFFRRDEERRIDNSDYLSLSNRQKESLLQDFAWWMIRNEKTTATPEETINRFDRQYQRLHHAPKGNGDDVMTLFLHRIGIIRQLAHQKIDFPHRTFQEYLAAKAAIEEDDLKMLVKHAHDDQWREVVILSAGLLPAKRATALIKDLLLEGDNNTGEQHALYLVAVAAMDVLVEGEENSNLEADVSERLKRIVPPKNLTAAKQLASAGDLVVPHLTHRKMRAPEAIACIRTLALIGSDAAHEALKKYATDTRLGVQESFIKSLRFARTREAYGETVFKHQKDIHMYHQGLTNLNFLRHATNLTTLHINNNNISDLSPLSSCSNLTQLNIHNNNVSDLSPLSSCTNLTELYTDNNNISDLSPLSSCINITKLYIGRNNISDLSPLSFCSKLTSLDISDASHHMSDGDVIDLTPLTSCPKLTYLTLGDAKVNDLTALTHLPKLKICSMSDTTENRRLIHALGDSKLSEVFRF